jgi:hypothetical protein
VKNGRFLLSGKNDTVSLFSVVIQAQVRLGSLSCCLTPKGEFGSTVPRSMSDSATSRRILMLRPSRTKAIRRRQIQLRTVEGRTDNISAVCVIVSSCNGEYLLHPSVSID